MIVGRLMECRQSSFRASTVASPCCCLFVQDVLRHALGLGADRALHVVSDQDLQPLAVARLLAAVAKREGTGLALLGKQAIDDDCNQTVSVWGGCSEGVPRTRA